MEVNVLSLDGKAKRTIELPEAFRGQVKPELIQRAALAESSAGLQPQAHFTFAGMQTSAAYHGRRGAYRSGRHMGIAIRPRENLGGGVHGKVRRIPSAKSGKRAHPHMVEKIIIEKINRREYQSALASAISATASTKLMPARLAGMHLPIIMTDEIETIKRAKDVMTMLKGINLAAYVDEGREPHIRKGVRRSTRIRIYRKKLLLVVGKDSDIMKAARNIPGIDICDVSKIRVNLLAPGGVPGRVTVWDESAVSNISKAIENIKRVERWQR